MKVKVVKCGRNNWWYSDKIGEEFEVEDYDKTDFRVIENGHLLYKEDVEVAKENTESEDPTEERVVVKGNVIKVKSAQGYCIPAESTLLKLTDTGNGYIVKFPTYSSVKQDNYVCLDYSEADYLFKALKAVYDPK